MNVPRSPAPMLLGDARVRRARAEQWILQAAQSEQRAAMEWTEQKVTLLTAGRVWDVVRVPYALLHRDFDRSTGPDELRGRVQEFGVDGSVFCDPHRPALYVLVPPGTDQAWPNHPNDLLAQAGVECMGGTQPYIRHVGVPHLDLLAPPGLFWLVPADSGGRLLADPRRLYEVLHACVAQPDSHAPSAT